MNTVAITIETTVNRPVEIAWLAFTDPQHITNWNHASDDWHSPSAANDLRPGGHFSFRMEAKDGSFGFDFEGDYLEVVPNQLITYTIGDGRQVKIEFTVEEGKTHVVESFEAESENAVELQKQGWQAILDNYRNYAEGLES